MYYTNYQAFSPISCSAALANPMSIRLQNNCYWTSLLRSDEKFYGLTGIFNYPKAMPSEGWVGWAEPKNAHIGDRLFIN